MFKFIKNFFDVGRREQKRLSIVVEEINRLEGRFKKMSDGAMRKFTRTLKKKIAAKGINSVLVEAFALVREASQRTVSMRPYDMQIMAALALFEGKVIEQKTGEGKTLSAVLALYLRALTGKGTHLVTVNDYLARRDAGWMGQIFNFLGLSVGCIVHDTAFLLDSEYNQKSDDERLCHLRPVTRKEAYQADVTYGTNNEFGFDYLRDNMVLNENQKVQRAHYFAIVDEVDFALIDEARTPLIISAPKGKSTQQYYRFAALTKSLSRETDYAVDEESRTVSLTDHGISKVEKKLDIINLYEKDFTVLHHIENALKAKELFHRDQDYIIKDGAVVIVDEFTGRLMFGRRWSDGLHQAVEAKENVAIQQESQTMATVSFQNYFRLYEVLSGMTGTALTSAEEFKKIYSLMTMAIPTNEPVIRKDHEDAIYKNQRAKYTAVAKEIEKCSRKGQPVLVGTTSIEKNEIISRLLKHKKISHQVLNAKNHEKEAGIIAQAGAENAVTVATNMAGRGVDIVLGGEKPGKGKDFQAWQKKHDEVVASGGLHVIGTERHEARRIDNQLRGRAGRQGDPGSSRFFIALDDDMMRVFGGDKIVSLMNRFNFPDNIPIENSLISRSIEQVQSKVEGVHFDARRQLVAYDDVMNKQREIIYRIRDKVLHLNFEKKSLVMEKRIYQRIFTEIDILLDSFSAESDDRSKFVLELAEILPLTEGSRQQLEKQIENKNKDETKVLFQNLIKGAYHSLEQKLGQEKHFNLMKLIILRTIDNLWVDHLDEMKDLREGVGLRAYGQQDPLVVYKNEAFEKFEQLMGRINYQIARRVFRTQLITSTNIPQSDNLVTNIDTTDGMGLKQSDSQRVQRVKPVLSGQSRPGRNDPCPCGSGKKYKRCCYPKYG